jgi:hypothetical protein
MEHQLSTREQNSGLEPRDALQRIARLESVDELLTALCEYGAPTLRLMDGEWYASVKLPVASKHCDAVVRSDFTHERPQDALRCCLERVIDAQGGT